MVMRRPRCEALEADARLSLSFSTGQSELLDTPTSLLPTPQGEEEDDEDDEDFDPDYIAPRKRPRREAASEAAKRIPRQPSPFELREASVSNSPQVLLLTRSFPSTESPPRSGGGGQSNRKVSHSLIERRRRERINDCLGHLKQLVPQCREEGEKKVARAKERGRKRGRKGEDGAEEGRGGLHKLEILQVRCYISDQAKSFSDVPLFSGYYRLHRGASDPHQLARGGARFWRQHQPFSHHLAHRVTRTTKTASHQQSFLHLHFHRIKLNPYEGSRQFVGRRRRRCGRRCFVTQVLNLTRTTSCHLLNNILDPTCSLPLIQYPL